MAVPLILLGLAGCAQVDALKSKVNRNSTTTSAAPPAPPESRRPTPSFPAIVNELQLGHYSEGEQDLRQYLLLHPGDRPAQAMLRQLTIDPKQALGSRSHSYTVQAGDSYSTLAARYLGDPGSFLILARYNGSANPSMLRLGETVHLPLSRAGTSSAAGDASGSGSDTPAAELPNEKAQRLQRESLSLLDQGRNDQALARLGEALSIDPKLKPVGPQALALREQLLASYHERAIVLYRDQQLDPAITLWNRILAIDPNYEPAVIYRARALELKHRLKQI
ncbi:LysM peptidoglycan-binding domain-containing protein [Rhodanobacter terrae]|uniref:LysM peptidoglycan-binding domain-containing protein n=1 Tax=Rhodanobacter terrae TaxID=418647 RepID=A0ABW0SVG7_9GAMM